MKYFIPAWYGPSKWWRDNNVPFHTKNQISEFDDMVSLMNIYMKNNQNFVLLQLGYHSAFRSFLFRNQLYEAEYWSLFDDIQGFPDATPRPLNYQDFSWPEGTEFIYTLVLVKAYYKNQCTNIYHNEMGYLSEMEIFIDNILIRRLIFDDRGILSSVIEYTDGSESKQVYLDIHGQTVMTENLQNGRVIVEKKVSRYGIYNNMEELIAEKLSDYLSAYEYEVVIAAADARHNDLIENVINKGKLIFSVFDRRNKSLSPLFLTDNKRVIIDSNKTEKLIMESSHNLNVLRITPFDTEKISSLSNQYYTDYIGVFIDNLTDEKLTILLQSLSIFLDESNKYKVRLITRLAPENRGFSVHRLIEELNLKYNNHEVKVDEYIEEGEERVIEFNHVPFENDVIKLIAKIRVIIDLSDEPDLYLQIASISAGIPQINISESDYVSHKKNGYILTSKEELYDALNYFLKHLKNWNISAGYSYKLIEKYSSDNIVEQINRFVKGGTDE